MTEYRHTSSPPRLTRRNTLAFSLGALVFSPISGCTEQTPPQVGISKLCRSLSSKSIALTISQDRVGGAIGKAYAGFSYEKRQLRGRFFTAENAPLVALFTYLGSSILRIGGNSVDKMVWQPGEPSTATNEVTAANVDRLAAFLRATGWRVIYGINLACNRPALAAAEAAHVARVCGPFLYAFEIGNEPDAYSFNGTRPHTYSYGEFLGEWRMFAAAVRQAAPAAALSGPASAWHENSWTEPFAQDEARHISLLTQHYYRANGLSSRSTLNLLLAGDPALPGLLSSLEAASKAARIPLGYRLTEANSFYDGGAPHISNTFGAALWALDFLFLTACYGASGVNFHGGGGAPGYTPIADDGQAVLAVRPEYYAMLLFAMIGEGTIIHAAQTVKGLALSVYAIAGMDKTQVLIVNKEPSSVINITISHNFVYNNADIVTLSAPRLDSVDEVTLGGDVVGADWSWSPTLPLRQKAETGRLSLTVAPATATLVTVGV